MIGVVRDGRRRRTVACVAAAVALAAAPSSAVRAQGAGAGSAPTGPAEKLDLNIWIGAANAMQLRGGFADSRVVPSSSEAQLGIAGQYTRTRHRLFLTAEVRSGFRTDAVSRRPQTLDHRAAIGEVFNVNRRIQLSTSHALKFSPVTPFVNASQSMIAAAGAGNIAPTTEANDLRFPFGQAVTLVNDSSLTYAANRASRLAFTHTLTYTMNSVGRSLRSNAFGFDLDRRLSRYRTLRLGYRTEIATFDPSSRQMLQTHSIDAGLLYERALPFSRGTTVSASTGSAMARDTSRRILRLQAHGSLVQRLSTTWTARVDVSRPIQMFEGLAAPLVSNTVVAGLGGHVARRAELRLFADYSTGTVGLAGSGNSVRSRTESVQWQVQVSRPLVFYVDAFHGRSEFGASVFDGAPRTIEQLGMRAFVSMQAPVFGH